MGFAAPAGGIGTTIVDLGLSLRGVRRLRARLVALCADAERSPFKKAQTLLGRHCPAVRSFEELTTTQLVHLWIKRDDVT